MTVPPITEQITFLYTEDLAKTAHFYEEVLALPLVLDQGGCRIYRVREGAYLGACEREDALRPTNGVIVTLVTPEVDAWYARLKEHDVPVEKGPAVNEEYRIYHCFVRDPNGYLIEFQRFLDEDWAAT